MTNEEKQELIKWCHWRIKMGKSCMLTDETYDAASVALAALTAQPDEWQQRAEAAEAKLAGLEKQEPVVEVSVDGRAADDYTFTINKSLPDGVHELFSRPAPAINPGELVPDGWKLVPFEPDWEMLSADGCKEHHNGQPCLHHDNRKRIWSAMLAASPEPE